MNGMISKLYYTLDNTIVNFVTKISMPLARLSLFTVYFWFGALKLFGLSPANQLVADLLTQTLPFVSANHFLLILGVIEMLIGLLFILPGYERLAIMLLVLHMITTALPLFLLQALTWKAFMVPTLEGQYIIKNMVIVALAMAIGAHLSHRY